MGNGRLRFADEHDLYFLFELANDPDCRKNSFHTDAISFEEHKCWFQSKMNSSESRIFIYLNEAGQAIGQARYDLDKDNAYISYSIDKDHRGQGHGLNVIVLLEEEIRSLAKVHEIHAAVKHSNEASKHIFERLGYHKIIAEKNIDYVKII